MAAVQRTILHVDMDAFFAAIEQRDRPELRGLPVVVGGPAASRGVVATASYEARRFGIRSAMPSSAAARLCPEAIFVAPRHDCYSAVSEQVMAILRDVTPLVEPLSIDEAFLEITGAVTTQGEARAIGEAIRGRLRRELHLTGSVGIGPNKFLAKLASDMHKPDGLTEAPCAPGAIRAFLAPLPVGRIWGVGPTTAALLERRGLRHIGDIQARPLEAMVRILGPNLGSHVHELAFGRDERPVEPGPPEEKSISHEETFARDIADREELRRCLLEQVERVGRRLRRHGRLASTIQIKVRFADFRTITRQQTLPQSTRADRDLWRAAAALFERLELPQPLRLIGFGVSGLEDAADARPRQLSLFPGPDDDADRNEALDEAVDALRQRFGAAILRRGRW